MTIQDLIRDVGPYLLVIIQLVLLPLLVSGGTPTGAVRIVQWFKEKLNLSGDSARALTVGVAICLAALIAAVEQYVTPSTPITPEGFAIILLGIIAGSQYWYEKLRAQLEVNPSLFVLPKLGRGK